MMKIKVDIEGAGLEYMKAQALKRGMSVSRLAQIVMTALVDLKLVDDTLDDEGKVYKASGTGRRITRPDAGTRSNINTPLARAPATPYRRPQQPTRADIRRDYETAVANTPDVRSLDDVQRLTPDQVRERVRAAHAAGFDGVRGLGVDVATSGRSPLGLGSERHESAEDMVHRMHTEESN